MPIKITLAEAQTIIRGLYDGMENLKEFKDCHMDRYTGEPMKGHVRTVREIRHKISRYSVLRMELAQRMKAERKRRKK